MTCPHLETTSAIFDGAAVDDGHAQHCDECRAFLADAMQLRSGLTSLWSGGLQPADLFRRAEARRSTSTLVPAFIALVVLLTLGWWIGRPQPELAGGFAGLDGGGRTIVRIGDTAR